MTAQFSLPAAVRTGGCRALIEAGEFYPRTLPTCAAVPCGGRCRRRPAMTETKKAAAAAFPFCSR